MTNELVLLAHWSVRQKPNHASSVQFSYIKRLNVTLDTAARDRTTK